MEITPKHLRSSLASAIARARGMRLSELERLSISLGEPVVALRIEDDGSVSIMAPGDYEADCSRAVIVRPWRSSEAKLRQAIEDALEVLGAVEAEKSWIKRQEEIEEGRRQRRAEYAAT